MRIVFPYDGYEHLGIGYLSRLALNGGHTVRLVPVDCGDYIRGRKALTPERLAGAVSKIALERPDVVAFSVDSFRGGDYCTISRGLRASGIRTIAGGPHASAEPSLTLGEGSFNALVAGEAESVFLEALERAAGERGDPPDWLWREDHDATSPPPLPDVDALPFPAKELFFAASPYEARDYKIITSRGCAFRCIFCAHGNPGPRIAVRRRNVGDVIRELRWARERFHPDTVYFLDDNFALDVTWLKECLQEYRRTIALPFHAIVHPSCCSDEVVAMLRESGCFRLRLGVQTLTPRIRKSLGRTEDNTRVGRAIASARTSGITVEVDHLVNVPGESLREAREEIAWYNEHRPDAIKVYWMTPLPGTVWFGQALRENRISEAAAHDIRLGKGLGPHSYLFYGPQEYYDSRWLGVHALLVFLPHLPKRAVTFLLRIRADRLLCIPSFLLVVGFSRLLGMLRGGDTVGEDHLRRLRMRLRHTDTTQPHEELP